MSASVETGDTIQPALQNLSRVYQTIIGNHDLNEELVRSPLPSQQWHEIEGLFYNLTVKDEAQQPDFFSYYQGITALRRMARILLTHVQRRLTARISIARRERTGRSNELPLLELTVSALDSNVKSLVDRLVDLFVTVNRINETQNGTTKKIAREFPELSRSDAWMFESLSKETMREV